uniref:Chloride channel protein n=2 Tax=Chrysotila carterae TaxID=13221 RepID=A0A7S4EUW2_CHRCT
MPHVPRPKSKPPNMAAIRYKLTSAQMPLPLSEQQKGTLLGKHTILSDDCSGSESTNESFSKKLMYDHSSTDSCPKSFLFHVREALLSMTPYARALTVAVGVGLFCGIFAIMYEFVLFGSLQFVWRDLGPRLMPADYEWAWIPIVCIFFGGITGVLLSVMGEPLENLVGTVLEFHRDGRLPYDDSHTMAATSITSIIAAGSLGPEAPLVAIGGGVASGFADLFSLSADETHIITIAGMSAGLVAFVGEPISGSLFACEVLHRYGLEYYEAVLPSMVAGLACNFAVRSISGEPQEPIWSFAPEEALAPWTTALGLVFGTIGGLFGLAWIQTTIFIKTKLVVPSGLVKRHILKGLIGGTIIGGIGMLMPETLFWAELEVQTIIDGGETPLPHVWPDVGVLGVPMPVKNGAFLILLSIAKMFAISITVLSGYRGGFIFPFIFSGHTLGTGLALLIPALSPTAAALSCAAAINASVTRTWLSSPLIVCFLSGQLQCMPMVLVASITALFVIGDPAIIKGAQSRAESPGMLHRGVSKESIDPRMQSKVVSA